MFYRFAHFICRIVSKILYRKKVTGRENIPENGPFIICSNHINWFDPIAVGTSIPSRLQVHFMAKEELFRKRFFAYILKKVGAFPVNRLNADYSAIRKSYQLLRENKIIGLFPEGTRSKTGKVQRAQHGTALIAGRNGAVIVPVGVSGPYRLCRPLQIRIGAPFKIPRLEFNGREDRKEKLEKFSRLIMDRIAKLLPAGD